MVRVWDHGNARGIGSVAGCLFEGLFQVSHSCSFFASIVDLNPQIEASDLVHAFFLYPTKQVFRLLHCMLYSFEQRAEPLHLSAP